MGTILLINYISLKMTLGKKNAFALRLSERIDFIINTDGKNSTPDTSVALPPHIEFEDKVVLHPDKKKLCWYKERKKERKLLNEQMIKE